MKTIKELINDFTEDDNIVMEQKYFDDVIMTIAAHDKITAIKIIKDVFKSGLYEAKQYFDKLEQSRKKQIQ